MAAVKWARIDRMGPHNLRRGSWYAVVDDGDPLTVLLDVRGVPSPVDRTCVRLTALRRSAWSVVLDDQPNPWFGRVYGVCPVCMSRERLSGTESSLMCPACTYIFPIDWGSVVASWPETMAVAV